MCSGAVPLNTALNSSAQLIRRFETTVGQQVVFVEPIARAGNVAGNGIDRLGQAFVALGCAGIDQNQLFRLQIAQYIRHVNPVVAGLPAKCKRCGGWTVCGPPANPP